VRKSSLLIAPILLACSLNANADIRTTGGITGLFAKQTATISQATLRDISVVDDLNISKNTNVYEINAGIYFKDFTIRGFYLQNRNQEGSGQISDGQWKREKDDKKTTPLPVDTTFSFRASRVEMGLPFYYTNTVFEPFVVGSVINADLTIQGEKVNIGVSSTKSGPGIGVSIVQRTAQNANITVRGYKTNIDSLLEAEYTAYSNNCFWKVGYSWRQYIFPNLALNFIGPTVQVGVVF
jgi:hypothetical protein